MKKFLIVLVLLLPHLLKGQDIEMFNLINQYRAFNNKNILSWSDSLFHISREQSLKIINDKAISHSNKSNEIAFLSSSIPLTSDSGNLKQFLKDIYHIDNEDSIIKENLTLYSKLYIIYSFNNSPKHKEILLGDYKYFSFHVEQNFLEKVTSIIELNGIQFQLRNRKDHYNGVFCSVIDFRK